MVVARRTGLTVMNLNSGFRTVVAAMKQTQVLTHTQKVTRLYRTALRLLDSWVIDRDLWNEEASKVRAQFDANKHFAPDAGYVPSSPRPAGLCWLCRCCLALASWASSTFGTGNGDSRRTVTSRCIVVWL